MDKQHAEEHYMQLQMIDEQMRMMEDELRSLEQRGEEIQRLKNSMTSLKDAKKGCKAFSSLGLGIYAESELRDTEKFLVNIGSGVVIRKSLHETEDLLDRKVKEIANIGSEIVQEIQMMGVKATSIQRELQQELGLPK